ncbi:MAG: hypothetical protein M3P96_13050 [Actinomycetota bacterium]|nr:hypothetical protein [Actinomycetota bacterium]
MRRLLLPLAAVGAALLVVAVLRAYGARAAALDPATTVLSTAGCLLCCGALLAAVVLERRPGGLSVPDGVRLPAPLWGPPLLLVGACLLVAGAYASPPFLVLGALLLVVAVVRAGQELQAYLRRNEQRPDGSAPDRATVIAARRVVGFGHRHAVEGDASVSCAPEHVGRGTTRLVLVGRDGAFGDVVVNGPERADLAAALAGAHIEEQSSREFGARVRTGAYEWRRMAGQQLPSGRGGR